MMPWEYGDDQSRPVLSACLLILATVVPVTNGSVPCTMASYWTEFSVDARQLVPDYLTSGQYKNGQHSGLSLAGDV